MTQDHARRLAVHVRQIAADTLERRVKDPRLSTALALVTVTDARVTADLREATVYYTVYGSEEDRRRTAEALESAKGVVRAAVGRRTGVKFTPAVAFVEDVVADSGSRIDGLIARARAADAELSAVRQGAEPAGDPDPYREPGGGTG